MKHSSLLTIATLGVATLPFLTSCQDEDFGYTAEQISYRTNFDKKFGKASNIPTFDLSTYNLNKMGLQGGPSNSGTRATGADVFSKDDKWFYVPAGIEQWLTQHLKENNNNKEEGTTNFSMSMPSNDILIIPVYQGQAGMIWDLYVTDGKIGDESVTGYSTNEKIWSKSEGIQVKKAGSGSTGVTYTNNQVDYKEFTYQGYLTYNNGNDKVIKLYDYLQSMSFNASTQWFKVEITNIDNNFNNITAGLQYIHEVNGTDVWSNFPTSGLTISNNSVTFECKDEEFLRNVMKSTGDNQVKFSIWSGGRGPNNENQQNTIKITIYEKTTTGGTNNDSDWQNVTALSNNENNRNTIGETIRAHAIQLKQDAFSGTFSMYLKITNLDNEYYSGHTYRDFANRHNQASTAGQMIALTALTDDSGYLNTVLSELQKTYGNEDYKFMFLGCEDANTGSVDWDMNDIVFLIVGKELPEIHDKDDEIIKKRYMIEDLGSTFDFDFNDIVVDVTQVKKYSGETVSSVTTTAELKHLCGTIPFQIGFGSSSDIYWFPIMPGQNNNAEQGGDGYTPTGNSYSSMLNATNNLHQNNKDYWNPSTNNIYVRVWPNAAGITPANSDGSWSDEQKSSFLGELGSKTFTFPETGEYPYIIATNQTVQWMKELITIPTSWFTVSPKNDNPMYGDEDTPDPDPTPTPDPDPTPDPADDTVTLPWTGPTTVSYSGTHLKVNKSSFADIKAGDKIAVSLSTNVNVQLCINVPGTWTTLFNNTANSIEYTIKTDDVEKLKAYGLEIQGNDATLTSIQIVSGSTGGGTITIWEDTPKDLSWSNWEINNNISAGEVISIDYQASNGGQMQVYNGGWDNADKETKTLTADSQTHTVTITAKGNWIVLQGQNCKVTKIYK